MGTGSAIVQLAPTTGTAQNVPSSSLPALCPCVASGSGVVACACPIRSNRNTDNTSGSRSANASASRPLPASLASASAASAMPMPSGPYAKDAPRKSAAVTSADAACAAGVAATSAPRKKWSASAFRLSKTYARTYPAPPTNRTPSPPPMSAPSGLKDAPAAATGSNASAYSAVAPATRKKHAAQCANAPLFDCDAARNRAAYG